MSLYLIVDLAAISIPLLFSFHPRIKFYSQWTIALPAIIASAVLFIIWDVAFTDLGVWGFNDAYLMGPSPLGLPIEEWLFFLCIPYACVFTHYTITENKPNWTLDLKVTRTISVVIVVVLSIIVFWNTTKLYTLFCFSIAVVIIVFSTIVSSELLSRFYITFAIILIPFFIVNGILTGSGIENEVVWYADEHNLGIRLFTIPVEDVFYAFSLVLLPLFIMDKLSRPSK